MKLKDDPGLDEVNILLVDDKPDNLTVLEAVLDEPGYHLLSVTSGREALVVAAERELAVILLDVQMPGMDGFETAKKIRALPHCKSLPIIFVTAIYGDETYINLGYEAGAVDYIFKPFNPGILRSKVKVFTELYRKTKQLLVQSEMLRETERIEQARVRAEVELRGIQRDRAAQRKYRDLVESIDNGIIWSAHPETLAFSFVSPRAGAITGYPLENWLWEPGFFIEQIHPDDRARVYESIQMAKNGQDVSFDHRFMKSSGRYMWFHTGLRLSNLSDESGVELRGLSVDITQVKESEQNERFLGEAGSLLSVSLDYRETLPKVAELVSAYCSSMCTIYLSDEGVIKTAAICHPDPMQSQILSEIEREFPPSLHEDRIPAKVIRSGHSQLFSELTDQVLEQNCANAKHVEMAKKIGLRSSICVPLIARGRTFGAITVGSADQYFTFRELRLFEELARRVALAVDNSILFTNAEKAVHVRDEFLSIASHELKTPLTPLKLQFQILRKMVNDGNLWTASAEKLNTMLERSDRQMARITNLIDDLLSVSRISLGRMALDLREVNAAVLVRDVVEQFKDQAASVKCPLQVTIDDNDQLIGRWDPFRIEQVVINLLTNALKYGALQPIEISLKRREDVIQLIVRDHGIGIEPKDHKRIFDLFERAVSAQNYGGLGLGLYIVRRIVEEHGGQVHVSSKVGDGSKFTVELPLMEAGSRMAPVSRVSPVPDPAKPVHLH
jgi:signal transduction histidine kinase/DNA-binding response OmpR family regulator